MIILGIDPGLATMGWGVISYDGVKARLVDYGALITPPDVLRSYFFLKQIL